MANLGSFPEPRDDDSEDVHWALSTAGSLQAQGDSAEALRWLRKAVAFAAAGERDGRAIELGRVAADFEERLGAVSTERGKSGSGNDAPADAGLWLDERTTRSRLDGVPRTRDTFQDVEIDGLDDPTHVDSSRRASTQRDGHGASSGAAQSVSIESEPTMVPHTEMSPGVGAATAAEAPPPRAMAKPPDYATQTLQAAGLPIQRPPFGSGTLPAYQVYEDDEATVAMRAAPNVDELGQSSSMPSVDHTLPAMSSLSRFKVAMLASSDGDEPRVMLIEPGANAPAGAGVAVLIPVSSKDADTIATLLRVARRLR
jgi:hypothetical protein